MTITYARYTLGRGLTVGPVAVSAPLEPPGSPGAGRDEKDALERSFGLARKASRMLADSYMFGEARARGRGLDRVWLSLEFSGFGRAAGARGWTSPRTGPPA